MSAVGRIVSLQGSTSKNGSTDLRGGGGGTGSEHVTNLRGTFVSVCHGDRLMVVRTRVVRHRDNIRRRRADNHHDPKS